MLVLAFVLACSPATPPPPRGWGQWVWTAEDARILAEHRRTDPDLLPSVLIAEVDWVDDQPKTTLRNSPNLVEAPRAVLIRWNEGWHGAWDALTTAEVADAWDGELARVLAQVDAVAGRPVEVQLDYDCPERVLDRYGVVLGVLSGRSLAGRDVWVTSLVAHVRNPAFGPALRGRVRGHLLQVFDTGDDPGDAEQIGQWAVEAGLPFRLGVGAFERYDGASATTAHAAWLNELDAACPRPACEGVWVFPGGHAWSPPQESR